MSRYDNSYSDQDGSRARRRSSSQHSSTRRSASGNSSYSRSSSESTYERYRRSNIQRDLNARSTSPRYTATTQRASDYQQTSSAQRRSATQRPTSYSRYEAQDRYRAAARERTSPRRSVQSGGRYQVYDGQNPYTTRKREGFSLPHIGAMFSGFLNRKKVSRGSLSRGGVDFSRARGPIIAIVSVALVAIIGILLWSNRKIEITVNGEITEIRVGSTIQEIFDTAEIETTPGNLISVSGNKLEDGAGYAYLVKLDDAELDGAATDEYRASEGDSLSFENGRDKTEDYDVVVREEQPKLEMGGDSWGNISYISQWPSVGKYEERTGKISGETARGDTIEETKNCIVSVHQISPDDGRKLVCLTFDDGPAEEYTEAYLEILDKYGIKATFFNLGQNIEAYPDLAKKIIEQGSEIMSHTYQHQQLSTLAQDELQAEFSNAFSDIEETVGVSTTSFRPPYGDFTEGSWLRSGGLASVSVLWNMDSEDWRRISVDSIVSKSTSGIFSGAIILMHDGGGNRDMDVEALPQIIETLQAEGYEFVTVTELMKSDSSIPEDIASGSATMPEGCTWPTETAEGE